MTRHEFIKLFARSTGLCYDRAAELVETFIECMKMALVHCNGLKFPGFGTFSVWTCSPYWRKNRLTGEQEYISKRRFIKLKLGRDLREQLNNRDGIHRI